MGLNAGLYVIPAKKFAAAKEKGTWGRHRWNVCRPWFDLDKAWSEFHQVLEPRGSPLCYAIWGNIQLHPEGLGFNFVSPNLVRRIARVLADLPTEGLVDEIERARGSRWSDGREAERGYYEDRFEELRKAYTLAAADGAAVGILIC